jgi:hypothetical protein
VNAAASAAAGPDAAPADLGLSDDASAKMRDLAGKALGSAVVSVERHGTDDQLGDHLVATVSLRKAYAELRAGLPDLFTGPMAEQLQQTLPAADDVPDTNAGVSFWVRDEKLTRVELDVAQFLDKPAGHLVLRADLLPADDIAAPSDAVAFDLDAIAQETGLSLDQMMIDGPPLDAHTIATYVDQDILGTASADGVPPSVDYLPRVLPDFMDMAPGLLIVAVGSNIQVNLDGQSACLTLASDGASEGTVVDAPC